MTTLLVLGTVLLLIVVATQIGRISELTAKIRGEESVQEDSNKSNATFGMFFLVAFLILSIGSAFYYKDSMLGYGIEYASTTGRKIQGLFNWTLFFTGIVFVLTQIALFWFAFKYRAQKGRKVLFMPHDNKLEIIWTVVPAVVMCGLVVGGLWVWNDVMADVGDNENVLEIEATAYQFGWTIRYPGPDNALGTKYFRNITPGVNDLGVDFNDLKSQDDVISAGTGEEIVLPKNKKVRVRITSKDVIHNFYLPHFSTKMDAIPGLPTYFVFTPIMTTEEYRQSLKNNPEFQMPADPTEPNGPKRWEAFNYELACSKLCGKGHYSMRRIVKVVNQDEYDKWASVQKSFFTENIKDKIEPGKYPWYKGEAPKAVAPAPFSVTSLETSKAGDVLDLDHVFFATGASVLTQESTKELDIIVDALNKNPKMVVEIDGHTDNVGDKEKNLFLSQARAKAVESYVEKKGVDTKRIESVGFGETKPIGDNNTDAGKQLNRRIEFKILSK